MTDVKQRAFIDTLGIETGHLKRVGLDSSQRKEYHRWAEEKNYLHVSYTNKEYPTKEVVQYFCHRCKSWHSSEMCVFRPCCTDEEGRQCCGGTSRWICPVCQFDDDDGPVVIWTSGFHMKGLDNYKTKRFKARNSVLISTDTNVYSESNRALFKACKLTRRAVRRQIEHRKKRFSRYPSLRVSSSSNGFESSFLKIPL